MSAFYFEPLKLEHLSILHRWMQEPHVAEWWGEEKSWSFEEIEKNYNSYTYGYKSVQGERKPICPFLIYFHGHQIGYIQMYDAFDFERDGVDLKELWPETDQSLAALDFYIGDLGSIGKGLGVESLKVFLETHLFLRFDACLVDTDKRNKIAVKTYAKAGFCTVHEGESRIAMMAQKQKKRNP
jgi:aminoglycoside 6'-N-acetyltransferase